MTKLIQFSILFLSILWTTVLDCRAQSPFVLGADLSYANMMEDAGAVFREDGEPKDVFKIFADNGTNLVRIRVWHNPDWQEKLQQPIGVKSQYSNFDDARKAISRAKNAGIKVMLDIHFSDFWCDPGKQIIPKAWSTVGSNTTILKDSVYNYVTQMLTTLKNENLMPEYVKVGNESNPGIMVHSTLTSNYEASGVISNSWARHAQLFNAAIKAVRDVSASTTIKPKIALHVADHTKASWFYNTIITNGVTDFDIMGFTYYYAYHGGTIADVGNVIRTLRTNYPKYEAMIVETGYLWDSQNIDNSTNIINKADPNYLPIGASNQRKYLVDLSKSVQNAGGSGVIFWEPAWVSTACRTPWGQGSSHEHVAFFDHRNNLNFMKNGGGGWPNAFNNAITTEPVNVTFKVDMTGFDVSNGVYITGSFTSSGNWSIVPMTSEGNNVYSYTKQMMPGDNGAYYFMNKNAWGSRETVPAPCAKRWNSDREYIVPDHDTIIAHPWSSCQMLELSSQTFNKQAISVIISPNPLTSNQLTITINSTYNVTSRLSISTLSGQCIYHSLETGNIITIDRSVFQNGMYLVQCSNSQGTFTGKLVVK